MTGYAVLVLLVTTGNDDALLLEVRSECVRQPGEICFPGGRIESGETPAEAAVREACEELGLRAGDISIDSDPVLQVMADGRKVWSVRGRIEAGCLQKIRPSGAEVAEVFLLPVSWLMSNPPEHYDLSVTDEQDLPVRLRRYLSGYEAFRRTGDTFYWEYENYGIWGLTARIIQREFDGSKSLPAGGQSGKASSKNS